MITALDLEDGFDKLHALSAIALPADARDRISAYLELLAKWNRTHNLTAIREPERMVTHHVLDSLAVLPHLPSRQGLRVLDVGSGAGLPGLLLAIARPDWCVVTLDSSQKKGAFRQQALMDLRIANAECAIARVEDYASTPPFDLVISRAFADLATFAAMSARHVAPGGLLAAMKGVYPHEEIAELPGDIEVVATPVLKVPGVDAERHLVLMRMRR